LGQAAKLIRCGTVPGGECLFIRYKSSVLHVRARCGVNYCICHRDRVDRACAVLRLLGACAVLWGVVSLNDTHEVAVDICALYAKIDLGGGVLWGGLRQWVWWMLKIVRGNPQWGWDPSWAHPRRWGLVQTSTWCWGTPGAHPRKWGLGQAQSMCL
jgi:hypothetical protein